MRNDDAIYSYVEKRMINPSSYNVTFDPSRHNKSVSFTVGDLLKKIIMYGFIIFIICSLVFYPNNKTKNKDFLDDMSYIVNESNNIMNTIVTEYNNNNFSSEYKSQLQNKLIALQNKDLSKYKNSKYDAIITTMNSILNETTDSVNIIINSSTSDLYSSGELNSNLKSISNDINIYKDSLFKFFDDNNIIYHINSDGSYSYQL